MPRKLLAAALPLTFAAACGHAAAGAPAAPRAVAFRAPVTAPSTSPSTSPAPVAVTPVAAVVAAEPAPAARPMCDSSGRPLAGNTQRKDARVCVAPVAETP